MRAPLDEGNVIKASTQFWEQMLAMRLDPVAVGADFEVGGGHLLGSCDLAGVWKGRIEVRLAPGLAHQATAAMLMQPIEAVSEADTLDATKEIANMIAGTIKSALPRPCTMTVPSAAVEAEPYAHQAEAEDALVVVFEHASGHLLVRVWEQEFAGEQTVAAPAGQGHAGDCDPRRRDLAGLGPVAVASAPALAFS